MDQKTEDNSDWLDALNKALKDLTERVAMCMMLIRTQDAECRQFHERLCEMEKRLEIK